MEDILGACFPKPPTSDSSEMDVWFFKLFEFFPFPNTPNTRLQIRWDDEGKILKRNIRHQLLTLLRTQPTVEAVEVFLAEHVYFILWKRHRNYEVIHGSGSHWLGEETLGDGFCSLRSSYQIYSVHLAGRNSRNFQYYNPNLENEHHRNQFLDFLQALLAGYEASTPRTYVGSAFFCDLSKEFVINELKRAISLITEYYKEPRKCPRPIQLKPQQYFTSNITRYQAFIPADKCMLYPGAYFGEPHLPTCKVLSRDGITAASAPEDQHFVCLNFSTTHPQFDECTSTHKYATVIQILDEMNFMVFRGKHYYPLDTLQKQKDDLEMSKQEAAACLRMYAQNICDFHALCPAPAPFVIPLVKITTAADTNENNVVYPPNSVLSLDEEKEALRAEIDALRHSNEQLQEQVQIKTAKQWASKERSLLKQNKELNEKCAQLQKQLDAAQRK